MKAKRQRRVSESRLAAQDIENFKRNMFHAANTPLTVMGADPDYDYFWFAGLVANQINPGRLEEAAMRNWVPVSVAEMPQMALSMHSLTREVKTPASDFICREGLILHKRLKEWKFYEDEMRMKLNKNVEKQISIAAGFVGDSRAKVIENAKSNEMVWGDEDEEEDI
jgi:hypothetical protein